MSGKSKHLRVQRGFTMAEVVMATLIFTASVVGISGMLMSGSRNVSQGATETAAVNLANRRLEEVKSLPYYIPWDPGVGNQDIDDFYYNTSQVNGVAGQEGQHPQLDHPKVVEDYGSIPGFAKFKRKTAIEYQYVSTVGGLKHLAPAVMSRTSPYSWVPNGPVTGQTDDPRGGVNDGATDEIHALVIEVSVYYNLNGAERVYKERSLVGALTTSGAYNQPYLLIQSINPTEGEWNDTSFQMTILVKASNEFNNTANVDVRLWRTGANDIPADSSSVSADGTRITSNFNLSNPAIKVGIPYNVSVYWKQGGWTDIFRSCFQVVVTPPNITGMTTPADTTTPQAWGYAGQTARRVIITGDHLANPTSVVLRDPADPGNNISGTIVNVPGTTDSGHIVAVFNLASITETKSVQNNYWDIMVTTNGGNDTSASNGERLLLNPTPTVSAVVATDTSNNPPGWFDWAFASQTARKVRVSGTYLYGMEMDGHDPQHPADSSAKVQYSDTQIAQGMFVAAYTPGTQTAVDFNDFRSDTEVVLAYDFTAFPAAKSVRGAAADGVPCDVAITNYGGSNTQSVGNRVKVNPLPVITRVTPTPVTQGSVKNYDWAYAAQTSRNVRIEGQYLYGLDQTGTSASLWYSGNKVATSSFVAGLANGTQTAVSANDFVPNTDVVMAFDLTWSWGQGGDSRYIRNASVLTGVPVDIQVFNYGNLGGTPATSQDAGSRVKLNPKPVIDAVTATNISASPNYFSWAHGGQASRQIRVEGHYLYGFDFNDGYPSGTMRWSARLVPLPPKNNSGSYWTATRATMTAGQWGAQTQTDWDNQWDETRSVVLTFYPNSSSYAKDSTQQNIFWNVRLWNFGNDSSTAAYSTNGVLMNPAPVITRVSATSVSGSPPYFDWAHGAQTSRNVRIEGNYLYALDQSDTTVQLEYGGNRTNKATFTSPQNPALYDTYIDTPAVMTFNPSSASGVKTASNTKWNVEVTNYGGTVKSNGDLAKQVKMNPLPVITAVTTSNPSASPNYFDWAHGAQTSRNVRVEGQYLYAMDQSDTSATLKYGTSETTKAAFTPGQDAAAFDIDINTPVVMTFNPSTAPNVKTNGFQRYNVIIANYGGTATSDTDAKRVRMNPVPTITRVTPSSSPSYFDWAYLSQTDRRVRVEGTYLYALDQVDTRATLKYGSSPTYETATIATFVGSSSDPNLDPNASVVLTFHPSSTAPAPPNSTYAKFWDVKIQNYGGTVASDTDAKRVKMNPVPVISKISIWNKSTLTFDTFTTAKSGSAADANYKTDRTYEDIRIEGSYFQAGTPAQIRLSPSSAVSPPSGTTYITLTNPTVSDDGAYISGLKMNVNVNPMTGSFKQWTTDLDQSDNTKIGASGGGNLTYYLHYANNDGTLANLDKTVTVSHVKPAISVSSKQPTWGTASVNPTSGWQDQSVSITLTATPASTQYLMVTWVVDGVDTSPAPTTYVAGSGQVIQARFLKKLYWSADGTSANWDGFARGMRTDAGATFNASDTGDGRNMKLDAPYHSASYGDKDREVSGYSQENLTGVSKIYIDWKSVGTASSKAYFLIGANSGDPNGTYTARLVPHTTSFAQQVESLDVSSWQSTYYIRVHAMSAGATGPTESIVRVYRIWLE